MRSIANKLVLALRAIGLTVDHTGGLTHTYINVRPPGESQPGKSYAFELVLLHVTDQCEIVVCNHADGGYSYYSKDVVQIIDNDGKEEVVKR